MLSTGQTDCSSFNISKGPFYISQNGTAEHVSGIHGYTQPADGQCSYTGSVSTSGPVGCSVTATANSNTGEADSGTLSNRKTCQWQLVQHYSPVIVDTTGKGFQMSDPNKNWVTFDLLGDGTLHRFSWPAHGSGNAWLVYDVNDDGLITNGKELFGNYTPHADGGVTNHPGPNGFLALAWYDQPSQGGNLDGIIDKQDAIWNHLKLWIDDHCYKTPNAPCTSVPSEIHSLASAGIRSISLVYQLNPANDDTDAYGNEFKIYVPLNVVDGRTNQKSTDPRVAYDVFLSVADQ
jgi:hypothetical protein